MTRRKPTSFKRGKTTWTNIELPRKKEILEIAERLKIEPDHVDTLLNPTPRTRLFESKHYLLLVVTHPVFDAEGDDIVLKELNIILTARELVTLHHQRIAHVSTYFHHLRDTSSHAIKHPAQILGNVLHALSTEVYARLDDIALGLDGLEGGVFQTRRNILAEILRYQTNLIDLQKAVAAQDIVLARLYDSASTAAKRYLKGPIEDLKRHSREIHVNLDMEQMTAEALHRSHEAALSKRTNRMINLLTKLSLFLLPSTLLAGIFGMNTKHPWINGSPHDFTIIILIMLMTMLILYLIVNTQKDD